jgi:hypothetical protein
MAEGTDGDKEIRTGKKDLLRSKDKMKRRKTKGDKAEAWKFCSQNEDNEKKSLDEIISSTTVVILGSSFSSMLKVNFRPHSPCQPISYFLHPHFASF